MKTEDIIIGKDYLIDLNHEKAYGAFCFLGELDNKNTFARVTVTNLDYEGMGESVFNVVMDNVPYNQSVGIGCFIKLV